VSDAGQPEDETEAAPEAPPDEAETTETEVPTGEPDDAMVAEATEPDAEVAIEPGGDPPDAIAGVEDAEPEAEDVAEPEDSEPEEPEPEEPEVDPVLAVVESLLPDLAATAREETVVGLGGRLDELVRLNRRADEHVAELHAENQRLRSGELATALQPMLRDLIRLHDEVTRLAEASHAEAQADLDLVRSRLLDTLARWGLSPFSPETGDPLDATRHQGVGRVPSSDGEPGTIATVRRPGFAHDDGRTFRAAEVEVFVSPPPPPTEET
jgi:molecular chaperone GrpE (heat shock protein)